jgi:hypothetical protein
VIRRPIGQRRQHLALRLAQGAADLDQMYRHGLEEGRHLACRPQCVAHQGAPTRAQLDQPQRFGTSELLPRHHAPQADQLAEDLADFRCRHEIASRADRVTPAPVAMLSIADAGLHKAIHRQRAVRGECARAASAEADCCGRLPQGEALLVTGLRCPAVRII